MHLDKKRHILTRGQFFMWHVRVGNDWRIFRFRLCTK